MRKQGGTIDVVVAVHGVGRPDQGYGDILAGYDGRLVIGLDQVKPILDGGMLVASRYRAAAVFDRADVVLGHFLGRDCLPFRLDYLTNLLLDAHLGEHFRDPGFCRQVEADRRIRCRPNLRMNRGTGRVRLGSGIGCRERGRNPQRQGEHPEARSGELPAHGLPLQAKTLQKW